MFVHEAGPAVVKGEQLFDLHQSSVDVFNKPYQCTEVNIFIKYASCYNFKISPIRVVFSLRSE